MAVGLVALGSDAMSSSDSSPPMAPPSAVTQRALAPELETTDENASRIAVYVRSRLARSAWNP
jgi:hypothetical protein